MRKFTATRTSPTTSALGGWRIGVARFPAGAEGRRLRDRVICLASEVWSTLAGPMQQVAAYAFAEPPELRDHLAASARLHSSVAAAVHTIVSAAGASCRRVSISTRTSNRSGNS